MSALLTSLQSMNDCFSQSIANLEKRLLKFPPGKLSSYITNGKYIRYKILMPDGTAVNVSKKDRHTLILMTRKRMLEALLSDFRSDQIMCELLIKDRLPELGIPFRYEAEFVLNDGGVLYPDFTLLKPGTNEIYILEHFGLMSDNSYKENAWRKIRIYDAHGFRMDDRLICFFEYNDKPLAPKRVRDTLVNLVLH